MRANKTGEKPLSFRELSAFFESAGMLMRAGIPLSDCPAILQSDLSAGRLVETAGKMAEQLGVTTYDFSAAMAGTGVFPAYAINAVRVGEVAGRQEDSFFALAAYYRREEELRQQIKSAVLSPAVLVAMMALVMFVTVIWILPVLSDAFAKLGLNIAGGGLGLAIAAGRVAMALTGVVLLAVLLLAIGTLSGDDARRERFLNRLPGFRSAVKASASARFTGALTAFLKSGLLPHKAMEEAAALAGSSLYTASYAACKKAMEEGKDLSEALLSAGLLDGVEGQIVRSASRAGQLDAAMEKVSALYAARAEESMQQMMDMVEPLLVGLLTLSVGIILVAVMLPLIQMMSAIG